MFDLICFVQLISESLKRNIMVLRLYFMGIFILTGKLCQAQNGDTTQASGYFLTAGKFAKELKLDSAMAHYVRADSIYRSSHRWESAGSDGGVQRRGARAQPALCEGHAAAGERVAGGSTHSGIRDGLSRDGAGSAEAVRDAPGMGREARH